MEKTLDAPTLVASGCVVKQCDTYSTCVSVDCAARDVVSELSKTFGKKELSCPVPCCSSEIGSFCIDKQGTDMGSLERLINTAFIIEAMHD